MTAELLVKYERVGEAYSGTFHVTPEAGGVLEPIKFFDLTFSQKIRSLHLLLVDMPSDTSVWFQRTERAGLLPVCIGQKMTDLIREDPTKYIAAHTIPDRRVVVSADKPKRVSKLAQKVEVPSGAELRIGHATLADAFGDITYLNMRDGRIEHPVTGRWCHAATVEMELGLHFVEAINNDDGSWLTVRTADLLGVHHAAGFYLPRAWNESAPWISREALQKKFDNYNKEVSQCLEKTSTP